MDKYLIIFVLLFGLVAHSQQVQCTKSGNTVNCVDWNAVGKNIGQATVQGLTRGAILRQRKFCRLNPGQQFHGYICPSLENQAGSVAFQWVSDHPKYHQSEENGTQLIQYMQQNNLSPLEYNSYNKAFRELRKQGKIQLNR